MEFCTHSAKIETKCGDTIRDHGSEILENIEAVFKANKCNRNIDFIILIMK